MPRLMISVLLVAFFAVASAGQQQTPASGAETSPQTPCQKLAALTLPETTVTAAEDIVGGTFSSPPRGARGGLPTGGADVGGGRAFTNLPAFCRVALTVAPQIRIEIWMPRDTWNGRFVGEGGGGYAGQISYPPMAQRIGAGYATASTDTGHDVSDGSFALNPDGSLNTQLVGDFAERAVRSLAITAKAVIQAYYGRLPQYSYWSGCSTGGFQGLVAVQRFPEAYDGLIIVAPAINWDRFIPSELWPQIVMHAALGAPISEAKLTATTNAAIAACDGLDGVVDGVIGDPRACTYDPAAAVCRAGAPSDACLTAAEASAIRKIWNGPTNAAGERLWFGLERGTPLTRLAGATPFRIPVSYMQHWVHQDPNFDWRTIIESRFAEAFEKSKQKFGTVMGADRADLREFQRRKGKMIIWHGEADELIFPRGTLHYFRRVVEANGGPSNVAQFARLYMVPGVGHSGGGPGAAPQLPTLFAAITDWVERGQAPAAIPASRTPLGPATRILCPYPQVARYKGTGNTDDIANYQCAPQAIDGKDFSVK
jgi:pimeloyl-ACP methyl ester carboxylesterase